MALTNAGLNNLADDVRLELESVLLAFDESWSEDRLAEQVESLPAPGHPLRLAALIELVKVDLERHWQHGRQLSVEDYLAAYPELGTPANVAPELLLTELEVRQQFGAPAELASIAERFPLRLEALQRLVDETTAAGDDTCTVIPSTVELRTVQTSTPGSLVPSEEPPELPGQFGRYRIVRKLGQGSMGTVYLAHDSSLDRQVALKVPRLTSAGDQKVLERFYREARAAATLAHPNLCPIYDVGDINGTPYLTMAFVEGRPLSDILRAGPLDPARVVALIQQLALALQEAHARGVIHRDLKPANVMLNVRGEPVVMDFGLARRAEPEEVRLTHQGSLVGTPAYMAPEQVQGEVDAQGPACDIYALGVILYEALAGRLPFQGTLMAVLGQIVNQEPEALTKLRPELDPTLGAICRKALAKKPEDRYASMSALAADLAAWQHGNSPAGTPARAAAPSAKPKVRKRRESAVGIAACVLLTGLVVAWAVGALRLQVKEGMIVIEDLPADAEVLVDGQTAKINYGPDRKWIEVQVAPGERKLLIKAAGFEMKTEDVTLAAGERKPIRIRLEPLTVASESGSLPPRYKVPQPSEPQAVNLLALIDVTRDAVPSSQWEKKGADLIARVGTKDGILEVPYVPPKEYDVIVEFTRLEGEKGPEFMLSLGGQSFRWTTGGGGQWYGPLWVDDTHYRVKGPHLKLGERYQVRIVVRENGFGGWVNGKRVDWFEYRGQKLRNPAARTNGRLGLRVVEGAIAFHRFEVIAFDRDRRAAEYVLSIGGVVRVNHQNTFLKAAAQLPPEPFRLTAVDLQDNKRVTDEGLACFRGCKDVTWLNLPGTGVSDAGLAHFKDCKNLQQIDVSSPRVTDAGLANFKDCHGLTWVWLVGTQVTDAGLAHLRGCKDLGELNLAGTRVTDAGLAYFKDWKNLRSLALYGTQVTDKGLATFEGRQDLLFISLGNTKVTDAGLENFKDCKGLRHLWLDTTRVTDRGLANFKDCRDLTHIWLSFTEIGDAGLKHLLESKGLTALHLCGTRVSDVTLELLAGCPKLEFVNVAQTKVTEAGVKKLAAKLPGCKIAWDGGVIEPSCATRFTNSLGMEFALVPKGKAWLGGGGGKPGDKEVEFKEDFYLGVYEVTQEEWERVIGHNPSHFAREGGKDFISKDIGREVVKEISDAELKRFPVEQVSWEDAQLFLKRLNAQVSESGWLYRLPTQAEWEYACRGGPVDKLEGSFDFYVDQSCSHLVGKQANFNWVQGRTCKVGSYKPNRLGLYDMHGNVWEWCDDEVAADPKKPDEKPRRAMRGGDWRVPPNQCRAGVHNAFAPSYRSSSLGLRAARVRVAQGAPTAAWVPLFNGRDLTGWKTHPEAAPNAWKVNDGTLGYDGEAAGDKGGILLYTERADYRDVHVRMECKIAAGRSGITVRALPNNLMTGYHAPISIVQPKSRTGSLHVLTKNPAVIVTDRLVPPDTWFTLELIVQGYRCTVKVNGKVTAEYEDEDKTWDVGHIVLFAGGQYPPKVSFRKIEVRVPVGSSP